MPTMQPRKSMERVIREDGRYPADAYALLHEGLLQASREVHGADGEDDPTARRHVTGAQMCEALRGLSLQRWGLLARTVLAHWNIRSTLDFGNMVYLLVRHGFMRTTAGDSIEDFRDVYDFSSAFELAQPLEIKDR